MRRCWTSTTVPRAWATARPKFLEIVQTYGGVETAHRLSTNKIQDRAG